MSIRTISVVLCCVVGCFVDASATSDSWLETETQRTISDFKSSAHMTSYAGLELGSYSEWKNTNASREREMLGRGALLHERWIYAFHQVSGMTRWAWRRSPLESYIAAKPDWEHLLTIDYPEKIAPSCVCLYRRCLLPMLDGNSTEVIWREYDLETRSFVSTGFNFRVAGVSNVVWYDVDTLIIKQTRPRSDASREDQVLHWSRKQPFAAARVLMKTDNAADVLDIYRYDDVGGDVLVSIVLRNGNNELERRNAMQIGQLTPLANELRYWRITPTGELLPLLLPMDAAIRALHRGQIIFRRVSYGGRFYGVRDGWSVGGRTWKEGSTLSIPMSVVHSRSKVHLVAAPHPGQSDHVAAFSTRDCLVLRTSEYTRPRLRCYRFRHGRWTGSQIRFPADYSWSVAEVLHDPKANIALTTYETLIEPKTLFAIDTAQRRTISLPGRSLLPFEEPRMYAMRRLDAATKDGKKVPYFIAYKKDIKFDGHNPTYIWFYGGWGVPELPAYEKYCAPGFWLQKGGVCVVANIRGGTEMGRDWYVRGTERRHVYNDIIAVAEDLIRRKITSPKHLGMFGHVYYGGLAAAIVADMRPDLFNAAVIENGILDVFDPSIRDDYELGSPEVSLERAYLESISPVQNLRKRDPAWPVLILNHGRSPTTEMARLYIDKAKALGLPYYFYDKQSGEADRVSEQVMIYAYFAQRLMLPER